MMSIKNLIASILAPVKALMGIIGREPPGDGVAVRKPVPTPNPPTDDPLPFQITIDHDAGEIYYKAHMTTADGSQFYECGIERFSVSKQKPAAPTE